MEFHVVVVKNTKLEYRDLMIEKGPGEFDLSAAGIRCSSIELIGRTQRDESREIAGVDGLCVLRAALRDALDEIESIDVRLGVLNIGNVCRAGRKPRVKNLVEVPRHQFETSLCG